VAFRTVVVSNEAELHVQRGQLVAVQEQTVWIPTEDIAVLVLENHAYTSPQRHSRSSPSRASPSLSATESTCPQGFSSTLHS